MGNKFTRVLPEMFLGNEMNSDGTPAGEKVPLKKLKLM
jgi:hypothetical protein